MGLSPIAEEVDEGENVLMTLEVLYGSLDTNVSVQITTSDGSAQG